MEASGANAQQIEYWNQTAGPKWVVLQRVIDDQIRPLGRLAMDRAGLLPGQSVIDVGCGCGDTTIELARRAAPGGNALGIDISAPMLERARERARELKVAARFEQADAQTHAFPRVSVDAVFSRFGVMFFADPTAAFTNLRKALRPGGRLVFVCWQTAMENPWVMVPMGAAMQHLPPPQLPDPNAPGPFAFADRDRVRGILTGAGFHDAHFEDVRETLRVGAGRSVDETVDFLMQMGPAAMLLRDADPALTPRVAASIRTALEPYVTPDGIRMGSACWIVTARA
jgi:SAM-dependent methyltransferase